MSKHGNYPGESIWARSGGKTPDNSKKMEAVIRWRDSSDSRYTPTSGYDHRITASAFLIFSGAFPPETAAFPHIVSMLTSSSRTDI